MLTLKELNIIESLIRRRISSEENRLKKTTSQNRLAFVSDKIRELLDLEEKIAQMKEEFSEEALL